ncbi:MAG: translation initiation factor IF-3 [Ignavibacteria bacterium]|nr:translation initiation factor IF-3 [Ignavibacteria bacterium]
MKDNKRYRERINNYINAPQLRVIDENGDPLGILSNAEAKRMANDRGLDLVEISPNGNPPVCKIVDYGKYNYERQKKEKEAKKNQAVMSVKEVRFNPNTDKHDIEFKTKHLHQFLMDGHKVKAYVMFKGRMITHPEFGRKLMDDIVANLSDVGKLEAPPKMEGKQLIAFFIPDKVKIQSIQKAKEKEAKLAAKAEETVKQTETTEQNNNSEGNNTNA